MVVNTMMARQAMRGPDHMAQVHDGACAMGHNRLSLVDLAETGDQPMTIGGYTLVYNGEIYNHMALRQQYLGHVHFRGSSDTETLLHLLAELGMEATLPLLRGMYAFALWNADTQRLYLATDPMGIKPLYVWQGKDEFAAASSSAALLALIPKPRIDRAAMGRFFKLGGADGVWEGIRRVHGGYCLTYIHATQRLTERRWYEPRYVPDAMERIDALLDECMQLVQMADVPVGLFLSGGVDSSLVAAHMPMGSKAYHLSSAELQHAQVVAQHHLLELHVVEADQEVIVQAHMDIARRSGEPTMAGHIPWLVSKYAAQYVKAAISANGADELFFGYPRTARHLDTAEIDRMHAHMMRAPNALLWDGMPNYPNMDVLADPDFGDCAMMRWYELRHYIQHDLNPTLDAASMCHGLEVRVPYLDHVLVETALSIPHTVHGEKRILRDKLRRNGIPASTIDRPKLGFSMPANGPLVNVTIKAALKHMQKEYGMRINPKASGRDQRYLEVCAMAWYLWELQWKPGKN